MDEKMDTNPPDLGAIEARANAASRGPWEHGMEYEQQDPGDYVSTAWGGIVVCSDQAPTPADAEFIAHAREDVPTLAAEVRRLRAALSAARREGAEAMREACIGAAWDNGAKGLRNVNVTTIINAIRALPLPE